MIDIKDDALTIRQTEDVTGVSKLTIQRHIKSGNIKATLVDGVWMIPVDELKKLPTPRRARGSGTIAATVSVPELSQVGSGSRQGPNFYQSVDPLPKASRLDPNISDNQVRMRALDLLERVLLPS
jgi:hypothetical protein